MGRLEKIVVVTVLFLVAVILGISLNSGEDLGGAELARNRAKSSLENEAAPVENSSAGGLMSSTLDGSAKQPTDLGQDMSKVPSEGAAPSAPVVQPKPEPTPEPTKPVVTPAPATNSYVVTTAGLEPTSSDDVMVYTWKQGDSFKSLSRTYYGTELQVRVLRAANEGLDDAKLTVGARVLVPVKAPSADARLGAAPEAKVDGDAAASWNGGLYTVKGGDVLGTISKTVYGTTKHWRRIYDANRDVIGADPNRLKVGMQLRIPEVK